MKLEEIMAELEGQKIELFTDHNRHLYAKISLGSTKKVLPLESVEFSDHISHTVYKKSQKGISPQRLTEVLALCRARAAYDGDKRRVYIRTAPIDPTDPSRGIEIDLGRDDGKCISITRDNIMVREPTVEFLRPSNFEELPEPDIENGDVRKIFDYVNVVGSEQRIALIAFMIAAIYPVGPYPFLIFTGEQGSGKSTATDFVAQVIDPRTGNKRSMPRTERDLAASAMRGHLLTFDNLSYLDGDISDVLCRMSTGGSFELRKLYSDGDVYEMSFMKPVIMNSIVDLASRPDLANRTFILELQALSDGERKSPAALKQNFAADQGVILGGICKAIQAAMVIMKSLKMLKSPRMTDAAKMAAAASDTFGSSPNEVIGALIGVQDVQRKYLGSLDPVCRTIRDFMNDKLEWNGEPTELYELLAAKFSPEINPKPSDWPKNVSAFARAIKRQAENLRGMGIKITDSRTSDSRKVHLTKQPSTPSALEFARVSVQNCDAMTAMTSMQRLQSERSV